MADETAHPSANPNPNPNPNPDTHPNQVADEKQAEFRGAGLGHVEVKTLSGLAWQPTLRFHQRVLSQGDLTLPYPYP